MPMTDLESLVDQKDPATIFILVFSSPGGASRAQRVSQKRAAPRPPEPETLESVSIGILTG